MLSLLKYSIYLYAFVPILYFMSFGYSNDILLLYLTTIISLITGFSLSRYSTFNIPFIVEQSVYEKDKNFYFCSFFVIFSLLFYALFFALIAIPQYGGEYRMSFFTEQKAIFGFEGFGPFFNIFCEFYATVFFTILSLSKDFKKYRKYIILWGICGTIITLGRWYILYTILLILIGNIANGQKIKLTFFRFFIILFLSFILSAIYQFRGGEFNWDPISLWDGFIGGVMSYAFVPIEMYNEYAGLNPNDFGINLIFGYIFYPVGGILSTIGIGGIPFEYDLWAIIIQDYVTLNNLGLYNAFVGQPLTSYVASGYAGVFLTYFSAGFFLGFGYYKSNKINFISGTVFICLIFGFIVPAFSSPMFFYMLSFALILSVFRRIGIIQF